MTWRKGKLIGLGYRSLDGTAMESFKVSLLRDNVCKSFTINEVDINEDLNLGTENDVLSILNKWRRCFAESSDKLGVSGCTRVIKLKDGSKPVCYRLYRLPYKEREIVRNKVKELLVSGIVRESQFVFASPIVLVKMFVLRL